MLGGEDAVAALGVPELLLTQGSDGAVLVAGGRRERIPVRRVEGKDPTGAGDAFLAGYVWARAAGHRPCRRRGTRPRSPHACWSWAMTGDARSPTSARSRGRSRSTSRTNSCSAPRTSRRRERVELTLPRLVAAAASGSTVVAVVDRRPPLLVSGDAGATWREAGGGLPPGFAVAIDPDDPDLVLYAARNRLYLSPTAGASGAASSPSFRTSRPWPGLRNPELAAGDDDRRAAHLHALDRRVAPQAVA